MSINKEAVKELVNVLRSGKYRQITGTLRDESDGRCCLGVACDVYKQLTGKGRWRRGVFTAGDSRSGVLPTAVQEYFGFNDANPVFLIENTLNPGFPVSFGAVSINDQLGYSFDMIANEVEDYYL